MPITQRVKLQQRRDAFIERPFSALPVDILRQIARQRCHHFHLMPRQEFGETFLPLLKQDSQVASVDHPHTHCSCPVHQLAKLAVQLRRTAGQIERADPACRQYLKDKLQRLLIHRFLAAGARVDMAMQAGLIAPITQIDL